ncbi:MAG: nuclear transport factor 2 family protein [Pyrinomonadaceae bacterium]
MKKIVLIVALLVGALSAQGQSAKAFQDTTAATQDVAAKYFQQYMAIDWEKLGPLMHDEISFEDPTAEMLFGGKRPVGKANVLKNFREVFVSITNMTPKLTRTFASGNIAVFEMDLSFSFRNNQNGITTISMPLVVVLTVKDGKVVKHRDYGDYREYLSQLRAAQEKAKQKSGQ